MKALISPLENNRIAEIAEKDFPVAQPLYWIDCPDDCTANYTYDGKKFIQPAIENLPYEQLSGDQKLNLIRIERNARLLACDWTQLLDTVCDKKAWATYRQALRDLPENITDVDNPIYPIPPM
jgi:hypothetical protein